MSRKVKFSNNWKNAKGRVQKRQARIANARRDYLHKASATISQNHALVVLEDLQVGNMSRSARGSVEQPGRHIRQKSGLNRSILDQGWYEFRRQLDYKLAWLGAHLVVVPPHNTSRTCPECGHVAAENWRSQARFACVDCGFEANAVPERRRNPLPFRRWRQLPKQLREGRTSNTSRYDEEGSAMASPGRREIQCPENT